MQPTQKAARLISSVSLKKCTGEIIGIPLSIVVTGANRDDVSRLGLVLDEIIMDGPDDIEQHLCAYSGCSGQPAAEAIINGNYILYANSGGRNPSKENHFWVQSPPMDR